MGKRNIFQRKEVCLRGLPICPGIAIGRPFFYVVENESVQEVSVPQHEIDQEVARFYTALTTSRKELIALQRRLQILGGTEAAAILGSHIEMMGDPLMAEEIEGRIRAYGKNTESIFSTVALEYEARFSRISDDFFRERVNDFQDISRRIMSHLRKQDRCSLAHVTTAAIIFAHELSPSDTAEANTEKIEAFVTRGGSETSHVAIMARAKGIPFVASVDFPDLTLSMPPQVIVNGGTGEVIFNPTSQTLAYFEQERKGEKIMSYRSITQSHLPLETYDGYPIKLSANIQMFDELEDIAKKEEEIGVGLFRSEYILFSHESFPSEDEQFFIYKSIIERLKGLPCVIRTFDIGGDKFGNFYPNRYERNPYLGCRAIRLMLKEPQLFKSQIRAILRAGAFGPVDLLLPMVSGVEELRQAKRLIEEARSELSAQNISYASHLPIGCMIEVPSAALICRFFAAECDFLSIGTNDLVQYMVAVDRNNSSMSYLYKPYHPGVIRLIKMIVEMAAQSSTPLSICGEIAGEPWLLPLLIGLGIKELSVSTQGLSVIKEAVRQLSYTDSLLLTQKALELHTTAEVEQLLLEAWEGEDPLSPSYKNSKNNDKDNN